MHIGMNKKKFLIVLCTSKTHWLDSKPQSVKITTTSASNNSSKMKKTNMFCPYTLLKNYSAIRPKYRCDTEQFFIYRDRSPVLATNENKLLKQMIKEAGIQEQYYCWHGLRAGRACDLLKLGVSVETIKSLGRWKSNAVFTYLKQNLDKYYIFYSRCNSIE